MKQSTKIIIAASLVAAITIAIIVRRKSNEKKVKEINDILDAKVKDPNQQGGQTIVSKDIYDKLPAGTYPLQFGSASKKMYDLQNLLNKNFGTSIDMDGKYGLSTWKTMCDKIWNKGFGSSEYGSCYDYHATTDKDKVATRRAVKTEDFEKVKNYVQGSTFDGVEVKMV